MRVFDGSYGIECLTDGTVIEHAGPEFVSAYPKEKLKMTTSDLEPADDYFPIPISQINPPAWNSRAEVEDPALLKAEEDAIAELARSIGANGLIQPITVRAVPRDDGKTTYILVVGTRRLKAAQSLKWETIPAHIREGDDTDAELDDMLVNIDENLKRKDLTTFEHARICLSLREKGLDADRVAEITGYSKAHIANLCATFVKLAPEIKVQWQKGNQAAGNIKFLRELVNERDPVKQVVKFNERVDGFNALEASGRKRAPNKEKGKKGAGGSSPGYPVSQKMLNHLIDVLSTKVGTPDLTDAQRKWGKTLVDYIVQARKTPPEGVPPVPKKESADK